MAQTVRPRPAEEILTEGLSATIANGASLSGAVAISYLTPLHIVIPAGFDGSAITFQGSVDGTTYYNLYDESGTEVNFPAGASRIIKVTNIAYFYGLEYIKIRSGTAASAMWLYRIISHIHAKTSLTPADTVTNGGLHQKHGLKHHRFAYNVKTRGG